ncbi:hypothetical protein FS837_006522 [Tulasnella sp. UAMH 9824]|nr:hypothetical protein FS837_006522 [Tulasnella sp. UAMH 9824]
MLIPICQIHRAENTLEEGVMTLENLANFRAASGDVDHQNIVQWILDRNGLNIIHRLPLELLQIIFHFVLFSSSGRRRPQYIAKLSVLRSVSSLWRVAIQRMPSLWTQLSSTDHLDFVSEALDNSSQHPLRLKFVGKAQPKEQESSTFLEKTFSHLHRWEYVAIQDPSDDMIEKYFTTPAPSLKSLTICTRIPWVTDRPSPLDALFGGELDGLEELRALLWKEIDWMGFQCRRLRTMEIGGYSMLDMDDLFRILGENPDLEVLILHFITFRPYSKDTQEHNPTILCKVTQFALRCVAELLEQNDDTQRWDVPVIRILRRIRIPSCAAFALEVIKSSNSTVKSEEIFFHIPHPVDIFTRADGQASSKPVPVVQLSFCERALQCRAFGSLKSLSRYNVTLQNISRRDLTGWILHEFNPDKWAETKLDIHVQYLLDEDHPGIDYLFKLQDWNSVVELDVSGVRNAAVPLGLGLVQRLESPQTTPTGIMNGPFLGLRALRLSHYAVTGKEVLQMVRERFYRITNRPGKISRKSKSDATGGGLTIILGDGMNNFTDSIIREIGVSPGVKQVQTIDSDDLNLPPWQNGSAASSESDWSPPPPSSTHGTDEEPEPEPEMGFGMELD